MADYIALCKIPFCHIGTRIDPYICSTTVSLTSHFPIRTTWMSRLRNLAHERCRSHTHTPVPPIITAKKQHTAITHSAAHVYARPRPLQQNSTVAAHSSITHSTGHLLSQTIAPPCLPFRHNHTCRNTQQKGRQLGLSQWPSHLG